jgi:hypothetical protein
MMERDLRDMQNTPVSPSELARAKTLMIRRIPLSTSSTESIAAE